MPTIIQEHLSEEPVECLRSISGADRYDEVWEGVRIVTPMPNHEHQVLVGRLTRILDEIVSDRNLGCVVPGVYISDRIENWQSNYRIPDVAVFLHTTESMNYDTFWFGGPDFAIEVTSPEEDAHDKLAFYGKVGTRELLVVERRPWRLELFRLQADTLSPVGETTIGQVRSWGSSFRWLTRRPVPKLSFGCPPSGDPG
ncbi:MAG: Uma2 family endonuclease [Planctomycetota bacterium]|nr:Uma2 family endonuclease [Planctomycetota bacterium]